MLSAASSTWSQMSSITVASRYMSSRAKGVTKVRLRRLITSWVSRSPSCSASRMSSRSPLLTGQPSISSTRSREISRALSAPWLKRSKNSRFWGVRRSAMGRFYQMYTPVTLGDREVDRRREPGEEAVDRERHECLRLEEAHQEADREVGRDGGTEGPDERLTPHAVPRAAEELGQLEDRGGADDRRREQEGETGGVLVREADEQAAAHRRSRAREARDQGERLRGADEDRVAPRHLPRDADVVVVRRLRRSP